MNQTPCNTKSMWHLITTSGLEDYSALLQQLAGALQQVYLVATVVDDLIDQVRFGADIIGLRGQHEEERGRSRLDSNSRTRLSGGGLATRRIDSLGKVVRSNFMFGRQTVHMEHLPVALGVGPEPIFRQLKESSC